MKIKDCEKEIEMIKDMKESIGNIEIALNDFKTVLNRPYKFANWITNLSVGLLGFYIAILLQMRGSGPLTCKIWILIILTINIIPIGFGIIFRLKYEIIDIYKNFEKSLLEMARNINRLDNVFYKYAELTEEERKKIDIKDFYLNWDNMAKWLKKPILKGIFIQFLFFLLSLMITIIFLFNYLLR